MADFALINQASSWPHKIGRRPRIGKEPLVLLVLAVALLTFSGCKSMHVSVYEDDAPFREEAVSFDAPLLMFIPPHHVRGYRAHRFVETDVLPPKVSENIELRKWIWEDTATVVDSYPAMARYCLEMDARNQLFYFTMTHREVEFKGPSPLRTLVGGLVGFVIPVPQRKRMDGKQQVYVSLDQGGELLPTSTPPRRYGARGESYSSLFTPLSLMIPKYRRYRYLGDYTTMSANSGDEGKLSRRAYAEQAQQLIRHAMNEAHDGVNSHHPTPISDESFSRLMKTTFGREYDPERAYVLILQFAVNASARTYDAGTILSIGRRPARSGYTGSRVFFQTHRPGSPAEGMTMSPGHLYFVYAWETDERESVSSSHMYIYQLGPVRLLAPVLRAWQLERDGY